MSQLQFCFPQQTMDGKRLPQNGPPVAKRTRYSLSNVSNLNVNTPNTTDSLALALQKVKHLLRHPVKFDNIEKSEPKHRNKETKPMQSNQKTSASLDICLQKAKHLIREPEIKCRAKEPNQKSTDSLEICLRKVKHLIRDPKIECRATVPNQKPTDSLAICVKKVEHSNFNPACILRNSFWKPGSTLPYLVSKDSLVTNVQMEHSYRHPVKFKYSKFEPTQPNEKNLMILNDDCLRELFNYLKPMELANFAFVNVRLNILIKRYTQAKYKVPFVPNFDVAPYVQTVRINLDVLQAFLLFMRKTLLH